MDRTNKNQDGLPKRVYAYPINPEVELVTYYRSEMQAWYGYYVNKSGDQVGDAWFDFSKEMVLINRPDMASIREALLLSDYDPTMTGAELREIRKSIGWTQQQLADTLRFSVNSIARMERDEMKVTPRTIAQLETIQEMLKR